MKGIVNMLELGGNRYVAIESFQELEKENMVMREALLWCEEFFLSRDRMNAKIHCAPLRLSPITERVLLATGVEFPKK